jgi:hypothetical protein
LCDGVLKCLFVCVLVCVLGCLFVWMNVLFMWWCVGMFVSCSVCWSVGVFVEVLECF